MLEKIIVSAAYVLFVAGISSIGIYILILMGFFDIDEDR
jgi:hypothetical protein